MRVASNTFPDTLVRQLGKLTLRQNRLQTQAATGQRVSLPDDDPAAMGRVLGLQNEAQAITQRGRNLDLLSETATASFTSLKALKKISDRAGEIAVLADGLTSAEEMQTYAAELDQLIQQGVQLANTRHRGDYLFAGTRTDLPAFVAVTDPSGQITAVNYQGNTTLAEVEVAEAATASARVAGANLTGSGPRGLLADNRVGADFFGHLISLRDHLVAGDASAISATDTAQLKQDEDNFLAHFTQNAVLQSRLETFQSLATERSQAVETMISSEADADLAQTLVRLNETQNAYRAALQSGGQILSQSLLDYLR